MAEAIRTDEAEVAVLPHETHEEPERLDNETHEEPDDLPETTAPEAEADQDERERTELLPPAATEDRDTLRPYRELP